MTEEKKNSSGGGNKPAPKMPQFNAYWIYGIILLALVGVSIFNVGQSPKEVPWGVFETEILPKGDMKEVVVITNEDVAEVTFKEGTLERYPDIFKDQKSIPTSGPHIRVKIPSRDKFEEARKLAEEKYNITVPIKYEERTNMFRDLFMMMWPILLILGIWIFVFRRMSGGGAAGGGGAGNIFNVGKSRARVFDKESSVKVTFNDVAGLAEAKQELEEIVEFLRTPEKFTELGGKIPKGALLIGSPGTGKTLLAKAIAGEADVPFFSMSGSDFVEMFVGVGASRVRDLFKKAKEKAPCIVFIDEIDAIGRARGKNVNFSGNDERENTLNQLLVEMDGFGTDSGIIILAATNRPDVLDPALLRPGRFDRQISIDKPDLVGREQIFKVHLKPIKLAEGVDAKKLSAQTPGFAGAEIANVCNEAALIAARKNKQSISMQDFQDAIDRVIGGLEKKNKIISPEEKKIVAYHEAGHAITGWFLEFADPLVKVSIVPRGVAALGYAQYLPKEQFLYTTEQLLDSMCMTIGGRVAEDITFGRISTGAQNDLERITKLAYAMTSVYGMNDKVGNVSFRDSSGESQFHKPYSD